jgi:integrase
MIKNTFDKQLWTLKSGARLTISKVSPCGSLFVRKSTSGAVMFFWRYTHGEYNQLIQIGVYDALAHRKSTSKTETGYSVSAAVFEAEKLARQHFENKDSGGYPQIQRRNVAEKIAVENAVLTEKEATLQNLLEAYCDYLKKMGRSSHTDIRSSFKKNVYEAWPKLANAQASEVTAEQIADILRAVHERGHARTSNKLRSYMCAAYQVAKSAKTKASIPANFKKFKITANPASDTEPDTAANRADKNPLSADEMLIYWQCIKDAPGIQGAVLRLHLLTGGLRIIQFVRLLSKDVTANTIKLNDIKGRPGAGARPYTTPLSPLAKLDAVEFLSKGEFAISTNDGKTHLTADTLSKWACDAVGDKIQNFQAKRIRSGVETVLAKLKFSKDLRGRLQSHGISGVQDRHYDGHDYLDDKLEMLTQLERFLIGSSDKVTNDTQTQHS